jgi:soluble lytic murein transglycosylase-like protein
VVIEMTVPQEPEITITLEMLQGALGAIAERAFYADLTGSKSISDKLLDEVALAGVADPSIFFAIMITESNVNPWAFHKNKYSIDRGLFQLNSLSYPYLTKDDFYDVSKNIHYGVAHYLNDLEGADGDERLALYSYNAGSSRKLNPPEAAIDYAEKILELRRSYVEAQKEYVQNTVEHQIDKYIIVKETGENTDDEISSLY